MTGDRDREGGRGWKIYRKDSRMGGGSRVLNKKLRQRNYYIYRDWTHRMDGMIDCLMSTYGNIYKARKFTNMTRQKSLD
jgi:hypothetical protein